MPSSKHMAFHGCVFLIPHIVQVRESRRECRRAFVMGVRAILGAHKSRSADFNRKMAGLAGCWKTHLASAYFFLSRAFRKCVPALWSKYFWNWAVFRLSG